MAKDLAIVLNDGGLNAAVVTAIAAQKFRVVPVFAEIVDPEQAEDDAEQSARRAAFERQATHFKSPHHHVLAMEVDTATHPASPDPRTAVSIAPRLVALLPLVATAIRLAARHNAVALYLGTRCGGDADAVARTTEFGQVFSELAQLPCDLPNLTIDMPLLELEAWQVVELGVNVSAPFEMAWSCETDDPQPCGVCAGCKARDAAFRQAAQPDPQKVAPAR